MSNLNYDVIIVGSGPAGGKAAYVLAENGVRTLVIEKASLPRRKICAGGITRRGMALVPKILHQTIERTYLNVDLYIHDIARRFPSQSNTPMISIISRDIFDHALILEAIKFGATLIEGIKVDHIGFVDNKVEAKTSKGTFTANFIILADGAHSPLAKSLGWSDVRKLVPAMETQIDTQICPSLLEKIRFDFGFTTGGYAWVFPKKDGVSIGMLGKNGAMLRNELKRYIRFLGLRDNHNNWNFKGHPIPMTPRKKPFYRNRILITGDSAGFVDPITGEGISYALKSGLIAAEAIIKGFPDYKKVKYFYEKQLSMEITRDLRIGQLLASCIYGPTWVRSKIFANYGTSLSKAMSKVINGELTYFELITDLNNYLKLLSRFSLNLNSMQ